jgi:lysophospholipase L1-like esterase
MLRYFILIIAIAGPLGAANEKNYTYLALGDSVAFGLDLSLLPPPGSPPGTPLPPTSAFIGYPELFAAWEHLYRSKKEVNLSCPGESTASFLDVNAEDYGCHSNGPQGQPPFKTWIGLHFDYPGTQYDFAIRQLQSNKHIDTVTVSLGANDILLLLKNCANDPACVGQGIGGVLEQIGKNLAAIAAGIRENYSGTLVFVTYGAPTPDFIPVAIQLNQVIRDVAVAYGAKIADGYQAFYDASAAFGHNSCEAGLVYRIGGVCDVHPTLAGQQLLAAEVEKAIGGK